MNPAKNDVDGSNFKQHEPPDGKSPQFSIATPEGPRKRDPQDNAVGGPSAKRHKGDKEDNKRPDSMDPGARRNPDEDAQDGAVDAKSPSDIAPEKPHAKPDPVQFAYVHKLGRFAMAQHHATVFGAYYKELAFAASKQSQAWQDCRKGSFRLERAGEDFCLCSWNKGKAPESFTRIEGVKLLNKADGAVKPGDVKFPKDFDKRDYYQVPLHALLLPYEVARICFLQKDGMNLARLAESERADPVNWTVAITRTPAAIRHAIVRKEDLAAFLPALESAAAADPAAFFERPLPEMIQRQLPPRDALIAEKLLNDPSYFFKLPKELQTEREAMKLVARDIEFLRHIDATREYYGRVVLRAIEKDRGAVQWISNGSFDLFAPSKSERLRELFPKLQAYACEWVKQDGTRLALVPPGLKVGEVCEAACSADKNAGRALEAVPMSDGSIFWAYLPYAAERDFEQTCGFVLQAPLDRLRAGVPEEINEGSNLLISKALAKGDAVLASRLRQRRDAALA